MYYILMAAIVVLDQIVKYVVDSSFAVHESRPVIEGIFHLTYVQNTGSAFSMFEGQRVMLLVLPVLLIAALIAYYCKFGRGEHWTLRLAISLIIAGGIGNLIDRAIRGFVVDMFDFRFWPVFNIADIAVCVGCGSMLLYVIFFDKESKSKKTDTESAAE